MTKTSTTKNKPRKQHRPAFREKALKLTQRIGVSATARTGQHPDKARFQLHNARHEFLSSQFFLQERIAIVINAMKLENIFCQVDTKSRYFRLDAASFEFLRSHFGTLMP
ncbi:hypothetical protein SRDD_40060 [Serratia sp. DD3]|nr:hypothetical protein SRDD_40060 [Serratia sp. DD3]